MVIEKLLIDPNSPAYEAARAEMVEVLRQIGREDSRNGHAQMADDLAAGHLMYLPTWIALALMASRAPAEQTGWQPIETAPKDGTTIDVWRDGDRETVYWGLPPHECGEMGSYCDSDWHSIKKPGWICSTFGEFVGGKHNPFTHWQPLPAPPGTTRAPADLRSALEAETIERCAKVAETEAAAREALRDRSRPGTLLDEMLHEQAYMLTKAATAIRALAPTKGDAS